MGPRRGVDTITPHTRPPADEDADRALVRVVTCMDGVVEATDTLTTADATGGDVRLRLQTDMALGAEGGRVRARCPAGRRAAVLLAVLGRGARLAGRR